MVGVAVGGLGVLVGLAAVIAVLLDGEARSAAWIRIATARRINSERGRELDERVVELEVLAEQLAGRERHLDFKEDRLLEREVVLAAIERAQAGDA